MAAAKTALEETKAELRVERLTPRMTTTNSELEEELKSVRAERDELERERDARIAAATAAEEAKARAEAAELAAALSAREAKNDVVAVKNDLAHARAALATARGEMDAMRAGMEEEARERERERAAAAATTEIEIPLDDPKDFSREAAQEMIKALTIRNAELSRELSREKKKGYGGAAVIEGVAGVLDMFFNGVDDDDDDGEVGEVGDARAAPEVEDTPRTLKKR
jgi:hypothetical protein